MTQLKDTTAAVLHDEVDGTAIESTDNPITAPNKETSAVLRESFKDPPALT